jgi:quinol monooxygenase YgiN
MYAVTISDRFPPGQTRQNLHKSVERAPMEFVVVARYKAREGQEDRVEAALRRMVEPTRAELGNLGYETLRDPVEPGVFVLIERYIDEDAFAEHLSTEHFATWLRGEVLPNLAERTRFDLVPFGTDVHEAKLFGGISDEAYKKAVAVSRGLGGRVGRPGGVLFVGFPVSVTQQQRWIDLGRRHEGPADGRPVRGGHHHLPGAVRQRL